MEPTQFSEKGQMRDGWGWGWGGRDAGDVPDSKACDREWWLKSGAQKLRDAVNQRPNVGVAKNVILFVGDGMGVSTVTAMRILKGQKEGYSGEEYQLHMEKMPYTGLVKTYNTNQQTPDSAGTATAFLSGVKTRAGVLGVDDRVEKGDCTYLEEGSLETMVDWALAEGIHADEDRVMNSINISSVAGYS
ncbi:hypothetical protein RRG08_018817 [Elysia crispata]|uniref:alkaline phosphatase n=1 Tax=Elysia crispata TaxID=231223 RepID=A0AAE1DLA1_9GAST|nr:hypothetical protein RRG08_018817 [Elysia crispata]